MVNVFKGIDTDIGEMESKYRTVLKELPDKRAQFIEEFLHLMFTFASYTNFSDGCEILFFKTFVVSYYKLLTPDMRRIFRPILLKHNLLAANDAFAWSLAFYKSICDVLKLKCYTDAQIKDRYILNN